MSFVEVEIKDKVAIITLNRPEARNAFNLTMCNRLVEIADDLSQHEELALTVLKGAGKAFCAGADLREINSQYGQNRMSYYFQRLEEALQAIGCLPMPVLAIISGPALGAGLDVAAAADIRICSNVASFGVPALKLGLSPTRCLIDRLTRIIGPAATAWVVWSAKVFTAQEAMKLGLVSEVWKPDEMEARLRETVDEYRHRSVTALRSAKQIFLEKAER